MIKRIESDVRSCLDGLQKYDGGVQPYLVSSVSRLVGEDEESVKIGRDIPVDA